MTQRCLTTVLIVLLIPHTVHAYIDPGTGALVLQFLIAGVLGVVFFFRQGIARFMSFFKSKPSRHDDRDEE